MLLFFRMARPRKEGLDYFPLCTTLDVEVESVCLTLGNDALAVWVTVLSECYRTGRSSIPLTSRTTQLLAHKARVTPENFGIIVSAFAEEGVFSGSRLTENREIYSHGVDKQLSKIFTELDKDRLRKAQKRLETSFPAENTKNSATKERKLKERKTLGIAYNKENSPF